MSPVHSLPFVLLSFLFFVAGLRETPYKYSTIPWQMAFTCRTPTQHMTYALQLPFDHPTTTLRRAYNCMLLRPHPTMLILVLALPLPHAILVSWKNKQNKKEKKMAR